MKKGTIYLDSKYVYKERTPKDAVVINIARKPMKETTNHIIELAPSKELFSWYQIHKEEDNWFKEYKIRYKQEIQSNLEALKAMRRIKRDYINKGIDVVLLCYCRNVFQCHRSILGEAYEHAYVNVMYR